MFLCMCNGTMFSYATLPMSFLLSSCQMLCVMPLHNAEQHLQTILEVDACNPYLYSRDDCLSWTLVRLGTCMPAASFVQIRHCCCAKLVPVEEVAPASSGFIIRMKVYAIRHHDGSLCTRAQQQPEVRSLKQTVAGTVAGTYYVTARDAVSADAVLHADSTTKLL